MEVVSVAKKNIYKSSAWLALRKKVLERDRYRCQIQLAGCRGTADSVDHRVEVVAESGPFFDEANLQASCRPCNSRKHQQVVARRMQSRVRNW